MRVLSVAAELRPLARVGELAESVAALAAALRAAGHDVRCALPAWRNALDHLPPGTRASWQVQVQVRHRGAWGAATVALFESDRLPAPVIVVEHPVFDTGDPYGADVEASATRGSILARALHDGLGRDGWRPDVLHAHDPQAAPTAALARWRPRAGSPRPAIVYTAHDLTYPADVGRGWLADAGLPPDLDYPMGPLEFHGKVNLHKLGIEAADRITLTSPSYAAEAIVDERAAGGLEGLLARHEDRLEGILHGVDEDNWDPEVDPALRFRYTRLDITRRSRNKAAFREELGLDVAAPDAPLAVSLGRLDATGGIDLLLPTLDALVEDGMQVVLLGTGEPKLQAGLRAAAMRRPGRLALRFADDERLMRRALASADLLLIPARHDPSGMRAMLAQRYGAVPVVHATGGLADVVQDAGEHPSVGNGFRFQAYQQVELLRAVRRAERARGDAAFWSELVRRGMEPTRPWSAVASRYGAVYAKAREDAK